jgi:hypothetical protein
MGIGILDGGGVVFKNKITLLMLVEREWHMGRVYGEG